VPTKPVFDDYDLT